MEKIAQLVIKSTWLFLGIVFMYALGSFAVENFAKALMM